MKFDNHEDWCSDRFLVTPIFVQNWRESGNSFTEFQSLEEYMVNRPDAGNSPDASAPYLRQLRVGGKVASQAGYVSYIYISPSLPFVLLAFNSGGRDGGSPASLDPEGLARLVENVQKIVDLLASIPV